MHILRSIFSVLAGLIVLAVGFYFADALMQKLFPQAFAGGDAPIFNMLISKTAYLFIVATVATCITGCIAYRKRLLHACVLGVLWLLWTAVFMVIHWSDWPAWFHLVSLLLVMPAAWLGGFCARRISPPHRSHGRSSR